MSNLSNACISTQALQADTALSLAQAQHTRALQELRDQAGSREQLAPLQAQLAEHQRRGQQLEEMLRSQAQKASTQLALQQVRGGLPAPGDALYLNKNTSPLQKTHRVHGSYVVAFYVEIFSQQLTISQFQIQMFSLNYLKAMHWL